MRIILLLFIIVSLSACENVNTVDTDNKITSAEIATLEITKIAATEIETTAQNIEQEDSSHEDATIGNGDTKEYDGIKYTIIEVDGGDKSGSRQANVAVDIGFGDYIYYFTTLTSTLKKYG